MSQACISQKDSQKGSAIFESPRELWVASLQRALQPYHDDEWWYPLGLSVSTIEQSEANKPESSSEQGVSKEASSSSSSSEPSSKEPEKKTGVVGSIFAVQSCYLTTIATGEEEDDDGTLVVHLWACAG